MTGIENDPELTQHGWDVEKHVNLIDIYQRNRQLIKLFNLYATIQAAAQKAQWRIIELEDKKKREVSC